MIGVLYDKFKHAGTGNRILVMMEIGTRAGQVTEYSSPWPPNNTPQDSWR
jgi:hypothetical protein